MSMLTHLDDTGSVKMVDVSQKNYTARVARAQALVRLNHDSYSALVEGSAPKGDVVTAAKLAGIQAAKQTSQLIPLCHQVPLSYVKVVVETNDETKVVKIESEVSAVYCTGVEMEALAACSVAALTVYDMLKAIQKNIEISDIMLLEKRGGRSGEYARQDS